jgi:hypothetical protein
MARMVTYLLVLLVCKVQCAEIPVGAAYPSHIQCQQAGELHREATNYKCVPQRRIER